MSSLRSDTREPGRSAIIIMKPLRIAIVSFVCCLSLSAEESIQSLNNSIKRSTLLATDISPATSVTSAKIQQITMAPGVSAPRHLHPCPTMGVVVEGEITFQIEGEKEKVLKAGDAFYEPANVKIARFDNTGKKHATFVVHYLLSKADQPTIKILKEEKHQNKPNKTLHTNP